MMIHPYNIQVESHFTRKSVEAGKKGWHAIGIRYGGGNETKFIKLAITVREDKKLINLTKLGIWFYTIIEWFVHQAIIAGHIAAEEYFNYIVVPSTQL